MARRIRISVLVTALVATTGLSAVAQPADVDLTTWTAYNLPYSGSATAEPGEWIVGPTGVTVGQDINGRPTFFASPEDADGYRITTTFSTPDGDDDFFGLALGFATDPADPASDYLLIDWKQGDQDVDWLEGLGDSVGTAGLAVSRVAGVPTLGGMWAHTGAVTELQRGATLGAIGWADTEIYQFTVEYTTESLDVWVDGSHEISMAGDFPAGPLALYNFSQEEMNYSAITFEPLNQPPEVLDGGAADVTVDEGQLGSTGGAFVDPDGDLLTLSCEGTCDGFSDDGAGAWSWSQPLPEGPDGFSVTVTASDGEFEVSDTFDVTVYNLLPVITGTSALPATHALGSSVTVSADFTDAGLEDTHIAAFLWGDGTATAANIDETPGSGTASGDHTYSEPGFYTVDVTVWDDDGGSDSATLGEIFVFDPDSFVTGGGWVSSPAGAWSDDPSHSGKATFGFNARYDKTGAVRGSVEFQLHKGINFHASTFDYLLINDGIAIFEGTGKVNGESGYEFKIVATDERMAATASDLFWITIGGSGGDLYDGTVLPGEGLPIVGKGIQVHRRG